MRSENSKSVNESSGDHENENIEEHLSSKEDNEKFEVANKNDDDNNTVKHYQWLKKKQQQCFQS